jgi:threonine synthase
VAVGVLKKLIEENKIDRDENIVCYVTGNGLKSTESIADLLPTPSSVKPDIRLVSAMIH